MASLAAEAHRPDTAVKRDRLNAAGELYLENSRLRNILADLLLEKMALEENLQGNGAIHRMVGRG